MRDLFKVSVLAMAIAAMPGTVLSAGLGKINVLSGLGQPLNAEVDLSATRDELSGMQANLASVEAFRRAGIQYVALMTDIRVRVDKKPDGTPYLKITSNQPVNDPFLDLLIEVNWSQGRLQREYTFLLDPPAEAIKPAPIALGPSAAPRVAAAPMPQAPAKTAPGEVVAQPRPVAPRPEPEVRASAPVEVKTAAPSQPAPSSGGTPAEWEVKRGDTLAKIAGEMSYEGVNLDQMLVAIYRDNEDAFISQNMNRLRTGKILRIPSREAVSAVDPAEARRTVRAQAADFNAYRRKLAEAARAVDVPEEQVSQQSASGKITASVEDKTPAPAEANDQLKVSRTEPGNEAAALQGKLAALEEETVAREKALREANERVAELEKNLHDLQKLLELKNESLAELQKQASAPTPEAAPIQPPAPKVVEEIKPAAASQPAETAEPPKTAEAPPPAPLAQKAAGPAPKRVKAPAPPPPEPSLIDDLLENRLLLAGGVGLIGLLGLVAVRQRRKARQEQTEMVPSTTSVSLGTNSVFGSTGGQSVDTSASSLQTDFSRASISAIDADEGVDPVAEADVYMAYGRDAQAEEILLDALKSDPTRTAIHAKLLEIYAARKNMKQFETLAGELYAQTGGAGPDWEKAAALGRKVDPDNPLYGAAPKPEMAAPEPAAPMVDTTVIVSSPEKLAGLTDAVETPQSQPEENPFLASTVIVDKAAAAAEATPPALDFDLDLGEPDAPEAESAGASKGEPVQAPVEALQPEAAGLESLDFDLGLDLKETPEGSVANAEPDTPEIPQASPTSEDQADLEFKLPDMSGASAELDLSKLDFDLDLSPASADAPPPATPEDTLPQMAAAPAPEAEIDFDFDLDVEPAAAQEPVKELDLASISLDLDRPAEEDMDAAAQSGDEEQEAATKLELAKAYEEMGDREGARELLQEVMKEGDATHQQRAREMLAELV